MKYKLFGKSGLRVSEICLGTMTFGEEFGWGSSKETSRKVFNLFSEAGGNFIDTANYYTKGTSEKLLGEFIHSTREQYVLATKYTLSNNASDPNAGGNHRKNMVQALENSLRRLNVDYIDLFWVHAWDEMTPTEEIMRAFDDLIRAGKVLYIGASNTPAWVVSSANAISELMGWTAFIGLQLEYSLIERTIETEFFPMSEYFELGITAWSPLGMGVLAGKYTKNASDQKARFNLNKEWGNRFLTERNLQIASTVDRIADEIGCTSAQVALNWVRQKKKFLIPIIGARNEGQLKDSLDCLKFSLTDEQIQELDAVSKIEDSFPYSFLKQEGVRKLIHGEANIER